jgi:hypothetical protein
MIGYHGKQLQNQEYDISVFPAEKQQLRVLQVYQHLWQSWREYDHKPLPFMSNTCQTAQFLPMWIRESEVISPSLRHVVQHGHIKHQTSETIGNHCL